MKKEIGLQSISALLILLFIYTAFSKFSDLHKFQNTLSHSPLIGNIATFISLLIPIAEITVSFLLLFPRTRLYGFYISAFLMTSFTLYVSYMVVFIPHLPCSCGGVLTQLSWKDHIWLNSLFTLLSFLGIWLEKKKPSSNILNSSVDF